MSHSLGWAHKVHCSICDDNSDIILQDLQRKDSGGCIEPCILLSGSGFIDFKI